MTRYTPERNAAFAEVRDMLDRGMTPSQIRFTTGWSLHRINSIITRIDSAKARQEYVRRVLLGPKP